MLNRSKTPEMRQAATPEVKQAATQATLKAVSETTSEADGWPSIGFMGRSFHVRAAAGSIASLALAACLLLGSFRDARADGNFGLTTVLVELRMAESEIRGTMWFDRVTVETKYPIDKDGDTNYTDQELYAVRNPLSAYVFANYFILWEGRVQPINFTDMVYDRCGTQRRNCIKLTFAVPGYRKDRPLLMFSRLLSDLTPQARTMVAMDRDGARKICVLAPGTYYDSRTDEAPTTQPSGGGGATGARFACAKMCLGMEASAEGRKCPRCGGPMAPVIGVPVPGKGAIGRLGGMAMPLVPGFMRVEGLMPRAGEFRLYLMTEEFDAMPVGKVTGRVSLWTENLEQSSRRLEMLKASSNGAYLYAEFDPDMIRPIEAQVIMDLADGKGQRMVSFYLRDFVPVESDKATTP